MTVGSAHSSQTTTCGEAYTMRQGQLLGNRGSNHVHKLVFDKCVVSSIKANDSVQLWMWPQSKMEDICAFIVAMMDRTIADSTEQIREKLLCSYATQLTTALKWSLSAVDIETVQTGSLSKCFKLPIKPEAWTQQQSTIEYRGGDHTHINIYIYIQ